MKVRRVLAIGAHPFDVEVLCGGTLLGFQAQGAKIAVAAVTDGAGGNARMPIPKGELASERRRDAQKAAKLLGASFFWLGVDDGLLTESQALRLQLIELVRQTQPDVVFAHNPDDYHPDNRQAGRLTVDACLAAPLVNIRTKHRAIAKLPVIYEMDAWIPQARTNPHYVDIGDAFKKKQKLVACNRLGVNWLRKFDGMDIFELVEHNARARGYQSGCRLAEAFWFSPRNVTSHTERYLP